MLTKVNIALKHLMEAAFPEESLERNEEGFEEMEMLKKEQARRARKKQIEADFAAQENALCGPHCFVLLFCYGGSMPPRVNAAAAAAASDSSDDDRAIAPHA